MVSPCMHMVVVVMLHLLTRKWTGGLNHDIVLVLQHPVVSFDRFYSSFAPLEPNTPLDPSLLHASLTDRFRRAMLSGAVRALHLIEHLQKL